MKTTLNDRDDEQHAADALTTILATLDALSVRERMRVLHSLIDHEARSGPRADNGYQGLFNFINDRYLTARGQDHAVRTWRYLASTRSEPAFMAQKAGNGDTWPTVPGRNAP